jgi:uncharacterized protein DUF4157
MKAILHNESAVRESQPAPLALGPNRVLRRKNVSKSKPGSDFSIPPVVEEVVNSVGRPLEADTRALMEPRFGHDFGDVRLHFDDKAAQSANAVDATAFTLTNHIVFGQGQYQPRTEKGQRLLAHELTHVVQQSGFSRSTSRPRLGDVDDVHERVANAVANNVTDLPQGLSVASAPHSLQRQVARDDDKPKEKREDNINTLLPPLLLDPKQFEGWGIMDDMRVAMAKKLGHEYINRKNPEPKAAEPSGPPKGTRSSSGYKWKPGGTAPMTTPRAVGSYSEGNTPVPILEPDEQRVVLAIYRSLTKNKTGKGDKLTDWTLKPHEGRKKTRDEQDMEVAVWGGKEAAKEIAEKFAEKKFENLAIRKIAKIEINLIAGDLLGAVAVATGAGEIVALLLLAWEIGELLSSLKEPAELTGWQAEDARIVEDVNDYFQGQENAADYQKKGFQPFQIRIRNPIDETNVVIPHY